MILTGEEFKGENPASENRLLLVQNYPTLETQQPDPEINYRDRSEDPQLMARTRAVGVQYEFAQQGVVETEDDRKKRKRRN